MNWNLEYLKVVKIGWKNKEDRDKYNKEYYSKNKNQIREQQKEYWVKNREKILKNKRNHWNKNREKLLKSQRIRWHKNKHKYQYPKKALAREKTRHFVKNKCNMCKSKRHVQTHHFDYDNPYETITLCSFCHKKIHYILNLKKGGDVNLTEILMRSIPNGSNGCKVITQSV